MNPIRVSRHAFGCILLDQEGWDEIQVMVHASPFALGAIRLPPKLTQPPRAANGNDGSVG